MCVEHVGDYYCYLICVLRLDYDLSLFNDFQIDWKQQHSENIFLSNTLLYYSLGTKNSFKSARVNDCSLKRVWPLKSQMIPH